DVDGIGLGGLGRRRLSWGGGGRGGRCRCRGARRGGRGLAGRALRCLTAAQAQGGTALAGALEKVLGDLGQRSLRGRPEHGCRRPPSARRRGAPTRWRRGLCSIDQSLYAGAEGAYQSPPGRGEPPVNVQTGSTADRPAECDPLRGTVLNLPTSPVTAGRQSSL